MLLLPIAAGLAGGAEDGAVVGFVAGMAADLLLPTPFGPVGPGLLRGRVHRGRASTGSITREVWWFPSLVALAASAAAVMAYAALGAVLGQEQFFKVDLPAVVAVVAVANAVLAWPAVRVMGWALAPGAAERSRAASGAARW